MLGVIMGVQGSTLAVMLQLSGLEVLSVIMGVQCSGSAVLSIRTEVQFSGFAVLSVQAAARRRDPFGIHTPWAPGAQTRSKLGFGAQFWVGASPF